MRILRMLDGVPTLSETLAEIGCSVGVGPTYRPFRALMGWRILRASKLTERLEYVIKAGATERATTIKATLLANNPGLLPTLLIERAKKMWLEEESHRSGHDRVEFTENDIRREATKYHPSLKYKKVARRHLEAEVELGELEYNKESGTYAYEELLNLDWDRLQSIVKRLMDTPNSEKISLVRDGAL